MKKLLTLLYICVAAISAVMAQPKIKFKQEVKEIGYVLWRNPATITYSFRNTGDKPLVISRVSTSCGCTVAKWTERPILAGEEGTITVTFDAEALGRFAKEVGVYCNAASLPIYLRFNGEVTTNAKEYSAANLHKIGAIGIDKEEIAFEDVNRGDMPEMELQIVNNSNAIYTPVLMHLPPYLSAKAVPERLGRGKAGKIIVTLDTKKLPKLGITTSSVYLSRFLGDKVGSENEIPVSVALLPDFSHLTAYEKQNPPIIELSESLLDFTAMKHKKKMVKEVVIRNKGKNDLRIQDLQVFTIGLTVNLNKRLLRSGEEAKMKVTLLTENLSRVKGTPRILMITNDPKHPKINIGIKTNIK